MARGLDELVNRPVNTSARWGQRHRHQQESRAYRMPVWSGPGVCLRVESRAPLDAELDLKGGDEV